MKRSRHSRSNWIAAVAWVTAAVLALAAEAGAQTETGWQIRVYAAAIDMNGINAGPRQPNGVGFDVDYGVGLGANAEYRFSRRLGIDLGVLGGAGVDLVSNFNQVGNRYWASTETLTITPVTAGLDIHLTPAARADVYFCPMVAWVQYGGLAAGSWTAGARTDLRFDEDFTFGATLGVGVPFGGERWSLQASLAYLDSSLEGRSGDLFRTRTDYDSTIFGLGFGYRFGRSAG